MNVEQELPSDSDDSDVDFVPEGEESGLSEEDTDENLEDESAETESKGKKTKRRKKPVDRKRKKVKSSGKDKENDSDEATVEVQQTMPVISAEEEKKKADTLWTDFMKDCNVPAKKQTVQTNGEKTTVTNNSSGNGKVDDKTVAPEPVKKTVKQIFEFAGEKIEVEKECTSQSTLLTNTRGRGGGGGGSAGSSPGRGRGRGGGGSGGMASILGQIGKKNKLSTLEKSKLDWDRFKKEEGIEEDLQTYNKGKAGYLEKQDFLERADLRQFEIEKDLRTSRRSNR